MSREIDLYNLSDSVMENYFYHRPSQIQKGVYTMKQYHDLQMRFPAADVVPGMSVSFRGNQYTLGQTVPATLEPDALPIGVIMGGYTDQFLLFKGDQPVGAAWCYFYRAVENKFWGVLDKIELEPELPACA